MWLLAAEQREEGSVGDAYVHFRGLSDAGRLLPNEDDRLRDRVEAATRFLAAARSQIASLLDAAAEAADVERDALIAGDIPVFAVIEQSGEAAWIWFAVSLRAVDGTAVPQRVRDILFAVAEEAAGGAEWEWVRDWPTGRNLEWFEVARLGLRSRR